MREIKFRAWDNEREKWIYDGDYWLPKYIEDDPYMDNCYPVQITHFGILYMAKVDRDDDYVEVYYKGKQHSTSFYKNWEAYGIYGTDTSEYTGLKDKQGVEIYEGDVLVHKDYYLKNAPQVKTVMEWHSDSASFTRFYSIDEFLVIGNIYENPELLTKE